ncbi:MAG: radical SAM family heme chaperone HemW [Dehalococcoidia bacterium]|nr:radical SAM family heme chaperone HemW [Dehalococcoidia bacterium]MDW8119279.1 radical SAM family heme chaperone HemW [Chloroflexota bacterium]
MAFGLYLHIPFCATKCPYCDFNTYQGILTLLPTYLEALRREILLWGEALQHRTADTLYLGGGTPSLLSPCQLASLLDTVRTAFRVAPGAEVTAEANPDDITLEWCAGARQAGINRLSIGVQSLNDRHLRLLGRRHTARDAQAAYATARQAGFTNINLDLMFGLPYQTLEDWQETLQQAVALRPEHLSAYCLTLEEGTPLEHWVRQGRLPTPDPDLSADMYTWAEAFLEQEGYQHYEISNWSRPGYLSRHNLLYWTGGEYLGCGPGAHSYLGGVRFANLKSPQRYIRALGGVPRSFPGWEKLPGWLAVEWAEALDPWTQVEEALMLGLRLVEGVSWESVERRCGVAITAALTPLWDEVEGLGLVERTEGGIRLTPRGRLLGNEVFWRIAGFCQRQRTSALVRRYHNHGKGV